MRYLPQVLFANLSAETAFIGKITVTYNHKKEGIFPSFLISTNHNESSTIFI